MKGKSRLCLSVCVLVFSGVGQPEETSGIGDLGITAGAVQLKGRFFFPGVAVLTAALIPFCALVRPIYELKV